MTERVAGPPDQNRRDWVARFGVCTAASIFIAILGPFATYDAFSFPQRLMYWGGLIMGLMLPAHFAREYLFAVLPGSELKRDVISAVILAVSIGSFVWTFNILAMGFPVLTPLALIEHVGVLLGICFVPVAVRVYLRTTLQAAMAHSDAALVPDAVAVACADEETSFLRRLEPCMRGTLQRVEANDHHLLVCTEKGDSRVRMRFSDAIEELAEFEGARIHRSHWVAFDAIDAVEPVGRRHVVRLFCGMRLPVSQNGVEELRAAGIPLS